MELVDCRICFLSNKTHYKPGCGAGWDVAGSKCGDLRGRARTISRLTDPSECRLCGSGCAAWGCRGGLVVGDEFPGDQHDPCHARSGRVCAGVDSGCHHNEHVSGGFDDGATHCLGVGDRRSRCRQCCAYRSPGRLSVVFLDCNSL